MDVGGIETSLFEIHALLATFTNVPELALEHEEAHALSLALANVQKHYPSLRLLSDKHMAIAGLGLTASRIYGKRVAVVLGFNAAQTAPLQLRPQRPAATDDPAQALAEGLGVAPGPESWFKPS